MAQHLDGYLSVRKQEPERPSEGAPEPSGLQAPAAELAVFLVPARPNARWFHHALKLGATAEFFLGRPKFVKDGKPGPGSRVAYGVPGWVDRLKQLGNAVVPQVAEAVGMILRRRIEAFAIQEVQK